MMPHERNENQVKSHHRPTTTSALPLPPTSTRCYSPPTTTCLATPRSPHLPSRGPPTTPPGRSRARPAACRPRRWFLESSRGDARSPRPSPPPPSRPSSRGRASRMGTEPRPHRRRLSPVVDVTPPPVRLPPAPGDATHRAEHRHDRHEPARRRDTRPSHPSPRPGGGRRHTTLIHVSVNCISSSPNLNKIDVDPRRGRQNNARVRNSRSPTSGKLALRGRRHSRRRRQRKGEFRQKRAHGRLVFQGG